MSAQSQNIKILSFLLIFSFLCILGCNESTNQTPGGQGQYKIAFNSIVNQKLVLYVINSDGTNLTLLSKDNNIVYAFPEWSPDGRKLSFIGQRQGEPRGIYVMNSDGSNSRLLADSAGKDWNERAIWSPDGTKILFISSGMNSGITIMNPDGTNQQRLASGHFPAWSRDGKKVAFQGDFGICVINADGTNLLQLTNNGSYLVWSPDGTKIVYSSGGICTINADGTNLIRLTNNPGDDTYPNWSPDGTKIVFLSKRNGDAQVFVMNADGTNQQPLANSFDFNSDWWRYACYPSWCPDGTKILFVSSDSLNLSIMNPDGTNKQSLATFSLYPTCSPVRLQ